MAESYAKSKEQKAHIFFFVVFCCVPS